MLWLARLISLLLLVAAVMAGVIDAVRSVAAGTLVLTPLGGTIFDLNPDALPFIEDFVRSRLPEFAWDPACIWVLSQPAFAVLLAFSLVFWIIGYRRAPAIGRFAA